MKNIQRFPRKANKNLYTIKWTSVFIDELDEIFKYQLLHYYNDTVIKFRMKLKEKLDILENNPMAYEEYQDRHKYRRLVVENYKVFYEIDIKNKIVYLLHIVDSRRKYFNLV